MKMVKLLQLSGLIVMLAFISACRHKPKDGLTDTYTCLLYTSPSPRDRG